MFGAGVEVAKIFLKKVILYYQNDELVHVVKELIMTTELKNNKKYLKDLAKMARDYNLDNIAKVLAY
ncbi:MAG: hypothetical protein H6621_13320 [Halobacteriovoraceae bacterium]|nr:hypothetical protein [Halobacteriovoraceae bacterium]